MDNQFMMEFLRRLTPKGEIKFSVFQSINSYSHGKMLDFINLVVGNDVATIFHGAFRITDDQEKIKSFKENCVDFSKSFTSSELFAASVKVNESSYRVLNQVFNNPATQKKDLVEKFANIDIIQSLTQLNRAGLVVAINNEVYCLLGQADMVSLTEQLRKRGLSVSMQEESCDRADKSSCSFDFGELTLSGMVDYTMTPLCAIFYFYENIASVEEKRVMRRLGLHLTKYPTVVELENSYFKLCYAKNEYALDLLRPINEQLKEKIFNTWNKEDELQFKIFIKLKSL